MNGKKPQGRGMEIELSELKENMNTGMPHAHAHQRETLTEKQHNNQMGELTHVIFSLATPIFT